MDQEVDALGPHYVKRLLAGRPFYIAHRMGGMEFPEYTRQGLDASLRAGFKALEVSVRLRLRRVRGDPRLEDDAQCAGDGLSDLEDSVVDAQ